MRTLILASAAIALAGAALASIVPAPTAFAQSSNACLRSNQIWSTSVVDDRTIIVNDRFMNPFVVELSGGCQGLRTNFGQRISFNTRSNLGCLGRGDRISFNDRILGRNTCFVSDVNTDLTTLARAGRPANRVARVN
jgi:hypothetical protein